MEALVEILRYVNMLVIAALAAVCARRWRQGAPGAGWVVVAFAALAALFASRIARQELPGGEDLMLKVVAAVAVLFPYLLFRFSAALARPSRRAELILGGVTFAVLVATVALPLREDPRPAWFQVYVVALLAQWAVVLLVVAHRLWGAGAHLASVARSRMRSLAFAAPVLVLAVLLGGLGPAERPPGLDLAFRLLVLASVLGFFLAFAPPRVVRLMWRQPEEERLRRATQRLMRATVADEVVASVLPTMAAIVGAQAVAMLDAEDRVVGSHGLSSAALAEIEQDSPTGSHAAEALGYRVGPLRLELPGGCVLVWASPYAPVFGEDEIELLRTLAALAELALERARLFGQEREARRVLERADELKTSFIALASHELRGPATVVYGLAELLHVKAPTWSPERQAESRRMLYEHARTLVHMIEQLLDLSRLEAGVIEIAPERVRVRERLERLVRVVAGERADEIAIEVEPGLEATVDPSALERVVSNLVANALRYGNAPVRVAAQQRDRHFRVAVEDRGEGVPREFVPQLFDRFARAAPHRTSPGGTGLGLAIARSYAQAHGGELLYREADPHGAHFEFVLPSS